MFALERFPLVMKAQRVGHKRLFLRRRVLAQFAFIGLIDKMRGNVLLHVLTPGSRVVAINTLVMILLPLVAVAVLITRVDNFRVPALIRTTRPAETNGF